jgi:hypothetical protein
MNEQDHFQEFWQNYLFHRSGQLPEHQTDETRKKHFAEEQAARSAWYKATDLITEKVAKSMKEFK